MACYNQPLTIGTLKRTVSDNSPDRTKIGQQSIASTCLHLEEEEVSRESRLWSQRKKFMQVSAQEAQAPPPPGKIPYRYAYYFTSTMVFVGILGISCKSVLACHSTTKSSEDNLCGRRVHCDCGLQLLLRQDKRQLFYLFAEKYFASKRGAVWAHHAHLASCICKLRKNMHHPRHPLTSSPYLIELKTCSRSLVSSPTSRTKGTRARLTVTHHSRTRATGS